MPKQIVVVGGGFAGLNVVRGLSKEKDAQITLIDQRNHHLFQPLLYQVAMAGLSPAEIASPIRAMLSGQKNLSVHRERVTRVDVDSKCVVTETDSHPYDLLVLACGARHSYFGHDEWESNAPGLKTLAQATEIRRRVLNAFEEAEKEQDPAEQRALLTFVVVGGGPTGVELAGAIGEMSRFTLARDFRRIDPKLARVILVEAGPRILTSFSEKLASRAVRDLESLGVQVWTSSPVTQIDDKGVELGNERIEARTTLWAAGVMASELGRSMPAELDRQQRVRVDECLRLPGHPEIFVIGDQAHVEDESGRPLPGQAPAAMQQGRYVAAHIEATLRGKPTRPFHYRDKGQMATIGRSRAICQIGRFQYAGFAAWLTWLFVHIYYLVGFKNRLFVVLQWALAYASFRRGARLIVDKDWRFYEGG